MTRKFYIKFSFFLIVTFLSILSFSYVSAQCPGASPCTPDTTCTGYRPCTSHLQYKCQDNTNCSSDILRRQCSQEQSRTCTCKTDGSGWDCEGWDPCYTTGCGGSTVYTDCQSWQICQGNTAWGSLAHSCQCAGKCLSIPTNLHLEDGLGAVPNTDVNLPVKFGWNVVPGAQSYQYRAWKINPPAITAWEDAEATTWGLTTNTLVIPDSGSCFLKLPEDTTYSQSTSTNWQVAPCCTAVGTECKNWSDLGIPSFFEISLAPQLISPQDPDWNNTSQKALDVPIPVTLDWCDVQAENAETYRLRFYIVDGGVETCHPWLLGDAGECYFEKIKAKTSDGSLVSEFKDDVSLPYFVKDTEYRWGAATCLLQKDSGQEFCSDYGQKWGFETADIPLPDFNLLSPPNDPLGNSPVKLPVILDWEDKSGINSFVYEVNPGGITGVVSVPYSGVILDSPQLSLVSFYRWKVKPCWDYEGIRCEDEWTDEWTFKTTGAKPSLVSPVNGAPSEIIPVKFDWNDVPGVGSYRIQISTDVGFANIKVNKPVNISGATIDYPDLEMDTDYWWRVQTCAHTDGTACGEGILWSNVWAFKSFKLTTPLNRSPINETVFDKAIPITFRWDSFPGAKAYQIIIYDPSGKEMFNKIISSNSVTLNPFDFPDLGTHTWKIKACLTEDCNVNASGDWSDLWSFDISFEAPLGEEGGLVPCGRPYDDPNTPLPMNERDACQIHHIFLLFRNVLDFLLWKVATVMLILLSVFAGILFHVSMGDSSVVFKVKSFLRSATIGFLIIFFAWLIVNLFLTFLGFNFQIFGHWWEIKF